MLTFVWVLGRGAIVVFFYRRPSGPGKPKLATTSSCSSAGSRDNRSGRCPEWAARLGGGVAWGPVLGEGPTIKNSNYQRFDNSIPL